MAGNELRAREGKDADSREHSPEQEPAQGNAQLPQDVSWRNNATDPRNAPEPRSLFTSDQYQPLHRPHLQLIPKCVDLYYEHIYPIMPLLYMPAIRTMIARPMTAPEKNLIYALCALVCMHMSGKSLHVDGPASWEGAGRFFLDECVSNRQAYDFMEDPSLSAVISSFWLSTSFFEINQNRKSWLYLREALTLAQDMGLHDDAAYVGLPPEEALCRQRLFWQLFVTERSFAILRNKPITFKKTPSLPTTRHAYESPDIHTGFLQLVSSYTPLDESFVTAWNEGSDPGVSSTTYLALQNLLAHPPSFLQRSRASTPSSDSLPTYSAPVTAAPSVNGSDDAADEEIVQSEPTAIQKADLLITQQWLRLIVWQSSFRQTLLSWTAPHESMHFAFPLAIARSTANVLRGLPSSAVEVHGMGIFEKIFEIATWCMNVLGAIDRASATGTPISGIRGTMGMDFVGTGDLGVLGVSRKGVAIDPLEFFVRTLSATPNSRTQFADRLLMFAQERPGGMRMALTPALNSPVFPPEGMRSWPNVSNGDVSMGNCLVEGVKEKLENEVVGSTERNVWPMTDAMNISGGCSSADVSVPSLLGEPILDFNNFNRASGNDNSNNANAYNSATTTANGAAPNNSRPPLPTSSLSMPALNTSVPGLWSSNDAMSSTQDWAYDLTSPSVDSTATYSNNVSAYNSGAGTPVGQFGQSMFERTDSGDSIYTYQESPQRNQPQHQQHQFGNIFGGPPPGAGGSSSIIGMRDE
ncbi:hypothetical protein N0V82_010500 [Gnomoniopsis sp. IMI 355080]|nr:hypothetical protein N0V82_010500 [Gnomoniopsis sp. IMI 355080]